MIRCHRRTSMPFNKSSLLRSAARRPHPPHHMISMCATDRSPSFRSVRRCVPSPTQPSLRSTYSRGAADHRHVQCHPHQRSGRRLSARLIFRSASSGNPLGARGSPPSSFRHAILV
ncbi:uncharacterized protein SCHCODRAFT_02197500 [Schizophyllum commune H4-8]|uniref:uncharacterized protein n=1 Tax=Schizophyllum commune (strain H4-8 / FGSC 9210) TaxID=578458 RepID=UPI00215F328B|nr:uncharacterized protein SCHCODRAFT_02197500 [Schizophyllum commune H4-8]KAI5896721.1 hypothetical protein SCHCODRAFT_02197500 [Schizophyllum commune H4-8]